MSEAEKILERFKCPWEGCDRKAYREYVESWLARPQWTCEDLSTLCRYYVCGVDDLAGQITKDKFGKG